MRKKSYVAAEYLATWFATGLGLGIVATAPGTFGTAVWGLPFAWAVAQLPGMAAQLVFIVAQLVMGVPLGAAAGRVFRGKKNHQAIIWNKISPTPLFFLLLPQKN